MEPALEHSRALWNQRELDLSSDEVLAQILDRGEMESWRAIYRLARTDACLRSRIHRIVRSVPLPMPHFWLAALAGLGERIENWSEVPDYCSGTTV
jgi:hypothetical protein